MKCLIFGGTRYVGVRLVSRLLDAGHEVTIATRGNARPEINPAHFNRLHHVQVDRNNREVLKRTFAGTSWDVVYDQIGYNPQNALDLCELFNGSIQKLIFTSTKSVYDMGPNLKEEEVDTRNLSLDLDFKKEFDYQTGKRLAEAVYFQKAKFPVCAVRFPIILGTDDYTKRLHFHVEHVVEQKPIYLPSPLNRITFISSRDAAKFLEWLVQNFIEGPVNACSPEPVVLSTMMSHIEKSVGRKTVYSTTETESNHSPFGITADWFMNVDKAQKAGFVFTPINQWLPGLIQEIAATYS